jgi:predicted phosphoribosyltransferase
MAIRDRIRFRDRRDAGRRLAARLEGTAAGHDVVVLALPRGGVPVACEVARALDSPVDVLVVRKLGVPFQPELAMGAIAGGGMRILNERVIRELGISEAQIERVTASELRELERRERLYPGTRPAVSVQGRVVILVDDGIATGSTMRVAAAAARAHGAVAVVIAVPVAPFDTVEALAGEGCEVLCLGTPETFSGISEFYESFPQLTDAEVARLLDEAGRRESAR